MGGGDLVSEGGLGGGRTEPETDPGQGRKLEGVGVGDHGYTAVLSQEGSRSLGEGTDHWGHGGTRQRPGKVCEMCRQWWRLVFVCLLAGTLPAGSSGKGREGVVVVVNHA